MKIIFKYLLPVALLSSSIGLRAQELSVSAPGTGPMSLGAAISAVPQKTDQGTADDLDAKRFNRTRIVQAKRQLVDRPVAQQFPSHYRLQVIIAPARS